MIGKLRSIFGRRETLRAGLLLALLLAGAVLETAGIGLIFPLISMLNDPGIIARQPFLAWLYEHLSMTSPRQFLFVSSGALIAFYLFKNAFLALVTRLQLGFICENHVRVSTQLLTSYLRAPYVLHLQRNTADIVRNVFADINGLFVGVVGPAFVLASELLVLSTILALLVVVLPVLTLIPVAVIGLVVLGFYVGVGPRIRASGEMRTQSAGQLIRSVNQSFNSLKEIRVLGKDAFFVNKFSESSARYAKAIREHGMFNALPRLILETVAACGLLVVILVMIAQEHTLQAATPVLALFSMAALRVLPSIARIMSALTSIRFYLPAVDSVYRDLAVAHEMRPAVPVATATNSAAGAKGNFAFKDRIEFRDVHFRYQDADRPAVQGLNIEIPKGWSVGFVGYSGAGKSTLIDLLLGLLTPERGRITVDGRDIQLQLAAWQRHFGYVPQMIYLLDDSVRRNVAFGFADEDIEDPLIWEALATARLDQKFRSESRGLDTRVGENGVRLSGGERQRIGIARAVFPDPEILVFDEATSEVDQQTEREVVETINALRHHRTLIVVAHRLASVVHCDRIYFMKDGAISDSGSFSELLSRNEEFRTMAGEDA